MVNQLLSQDQNASHIIHSISYTLEMQIMHQLEIFRKDLPVKLCYVRHN